MDKDNDSILEGQVKAIILIQSKKEIVDYTKNRLVVSLQVFLPDLHLILTLEMDRE